MLKISALIISILLLIPGLLGGFAGCEQEEEEVFDKEDLYAVNNYVEEMTAAMQEVVPDLKGWSRAPHAEDEMPLEYDQERMQWLGEHRDQLEEIKQEHFENRIPELEKIEQWEVVVVRGTEEWLMKGPEVVEALEKLNEFARDLKSSIDMIKENDGQLDEEQSEEIKELIEQVEPVTEEVRHQIFKE